MVLRSRRQGRLISSEEPKIESWVSREVHSAAFNGEFEQEHEEGSVFRDDEHSQDLAVVASLKACADDKDLNVGRSLHADILKRGSLELNIFIGSTLVNLYAKCGALAKAQQVLAELPTSHVVSWNSLIAGYAQHDHGDEALKCFDRMLSSGLSPDPVTFACILKACGSTEASEKGKELHAEILRQGLLGTNIVVGNALVDMYAKCGAIAKAQQVFEELSSRNVISWTTLIAGLCQHEHSEAALIFFEQMQQEGLFPNAMTFACALKACGSIGAFEKGKDIHIEILSKGLLGNDIVLGNALIIMYIKCGDLTRAQQVFDDLPVRNVVSWTGLITGYCLHGHGEEALNCFERMKDHGFFPNAMTFSCILKACGSIGAAEKGEEIYAEIARKGLLGRNIVVGNALVDMYAKCGTLAKAKEVFDKLPAADVVSWTTLIAGFCEQGYCEEAFSYFEGMKQEGFSPDAVTFACILRACGSLGAAEKGQMYFESMSTRYGIVPKLEHHTCMMLLFGREGHFNKATTMIKKMPSVESLPAWLALEGACQKWGNSKLGRLAFEHCAIR